MDDGGCEVFWRESGGPAVARSGRSGFGTALIERAVPYDLGGESETRLDAAGLQARFLLPARHVLSAGFAGDDAAAVAGPDAAASDPLDNVAVLLVEDQMLIAMDVEFMLEDAGIANVVTAPSSADALRRLKDFTPDVAALDVNLGAGTSAPVAIELQRRGVPFIFATGYGDRSMIPPGCEQVPVLTKPYEREPLIAALQELCQQGGVQPPLAP